LQKLIKFRGKFLWQTTLSGRNLIKAICLRDCQLEDSLIKLTLQRLVKSFTTSLVMKTMNGVIYLKITLLINRFLTADNYQRLRKCLKHSAITSNTAQIKAI
jgi:hypothetical protein